ncbi:hypothetical protein [Ilumatobacter sp.]|uniref:hypothetical protein n=1 Tax=Ilumatobacter sp. TaxID=1967498 RepID=UPI003B52E508
MAEQDPFSQMFSVLSAPLSATIQSFEQFRKGVEQFQRGVDNFNRTMENLNETSERINRLLSDVEEPLRAAVPQVTRTVKAADEMMKVVSGPAIAVAPGLKVLAETLNNPAMRQMPNQLAQMNEVLADVTARLQPLGQLAESAGGLFGGFKIPGFGAPGKTAAATAPTTASAQQPTAEEPAAPKKAARKKAAARKKTASEKRSGSAST